MQIHRAKYELTALFAAALLGWLCLHAQEKAPVATVPVRMTVTVQGIGENKGLPDIKPEAVVVRQGQDRLQGTG